MVGGGCLDRIVRDRDRLDGVNHPKELMLASLQAGNKHIDPAQESLAPLVENLAGDRGEAAAQATSRFK